MEDENQEYTVQILYPEFFTDSNNPWSSAKAQIKNLFSKSVQLKHLKGLFEKKQAQNFHCNKQMERYQEDFHYCSDCGINSNQAYYCSDCFDSDYHENHDTGTMYDEGDREWYPSCTCGIKWQCDYKSFCEDHGNDSVEVQLNQEELKKFITFFKPIYKVLLFTKSKKQYDQLAAQIEKQLMQTLGQLNERCLEYIRMTTALFQQIVQQGQEQVTLLQCLMKNCSHDKLFQVMKSDGIFRFKFTKMNVLLKEKGRQLNFSISRDCENDPQIIYKLSEDKKFFPQKLRQLVKVSQRKSHAVQQCIKYTQIVKNDKHELIKFIVQSIKESDLANLDGETLEFLMIKVFSFFGLENLTFGFEVQNIIKFLVFLVVHHFKGQFQKLFNLTQHLNAIGISSQSIEKFLFFASHINQRNTIMIKQFGLCYFLLLLQSENSYDHVSQFWSVFFKEDSYIDKDIDKLYTILSRVLNIQSVCESLKKEILEENKDESESSEEKQQEDNQKMNEEQKQKKQKIKKEKKLKQDFIKFLKEKKQIQKRDIWNKKRNGKLAFLNSGELLTSLCYFNEQLETFIFKQANTESENVHQIIQIPLFPDDKNSAQEKATYFNNFNLTYKDDLTITKELPLKMLKLIFSSPSFFKSFKEKWQKTLQQNPSEESYEMRKWKEFKTGNIFIFFLIFSDKMVQNENPELKQEIQKFRSDPTYRYTFEHYGQPNKISTLLSINESNVAKTVLKLKQGVKNQSNKEGEEQIAKEMESSVKLRAADKKKKMYQKYKKKGEKLMHNLATKSLILSVNDTDDLCLLCHQKQKPKNKMVFLANLQKQSLKTCSIFGEQNKARTLFLSCQHTVHIKCFIDMMKGRSLGRYNCPLCSTELSCILPVSYSSIEDEEMLQLCFSSICISIGVHSNLYNTQSLFILLFKHLVESKGLTSIVSLTRYESEKYIWRKTNKYIENLLKSIYQMRPEKQKFQKDVHNFIEQINTCENQCLKDIQMLLTETLFQKIKGNSYINLKLFGQLKSKIISSEFEVIHGQLQEFIQRPIQFIEEELSFDKISLSFKIVDPPEDTRELILLKNASCTFCNERNNEYKCLICGQIICGTCFSNHQQKHKKCNFYLYFYQMRIQMQTPRRNQYFDIYYSDFKMSYYDANYEEKEQDVFYLNEKKFKEAKHKFLNE